MSLCCALAFIYSTLSVAVVGPTVRALPFVVAPVVEDSANANVISGDGVTDETICDVLDRESVFAKEEMTPKIDGNSLRAEGQCHCSYRPYNGSIVIGLDHHPLKS